MAKSLLDPKFIGRRLAQVRKHLGYSKRKLSIQAGLRHNFVYDIEGGRTGKNIQPENLRALLKVLRITEEQFFDPTQLPDASETEEPTNEFKIPVYGEVPAGNPTWTEGQQDPIDYVEGTARDESLKAFALRVCGKSMSPRFEHGDTIILQPLNIFLPIKDAENLTPRATFDSLKGRTVSVMVNNEATLKELDISPHETNPDDYWIHLKPVNPSYATITIQPEDEVLFQGVVYRLLRDNP